MNPATQLYSTVPKRKLITNSIPFIKTEAKYSISGNSHSSHCSLENENILNKCESSNRSLSSDMSCSHKCRNHPSKNAQYEGQTQTENEFNYFCERCAILVASQGFNVEKIVSITSGRSLPDSEPRKQQVEGFLDRIKGLENHLTAKREDVREVLISSQEFYGSQIEDINQYFQLIAQSLELEKNKCYNHILHERMNAQDCTRKVSEAIDCLQSQLSQIIEDIEQSIEAVYEIDEATYRPVIASYQGRLLQFQQSAQALIVEPIQLRKVQFQGVPESIHSISDIFIQNSVGGMSEIPLARPSLGNHQSRFRRDVQVQNQPRESHGLRDHRGSLMFSFQGDQLVTGQSEEALRGYLKTWD